MITNQTVFRWFVIVVIILSFVAAAGTPSYNCSQLYVYLSGD